MMNFRQLKYFIAVAKTGQFTKAANLIHVSQPALGLQVKNLEDELGVLLFDRNSRGGELTSNGKIFLSYAKDIFEKIEEAKKALTSSRDRRNLRIGFTPTIGRHLLHPILAACTERFQDIQLVITEGYSDELRLDLQMDELDFAFSYEVGSDDRVIARALLVDQFYLVGPVDGSRSNKEIDLAELARYPLVSEKKRQGTLEALKFKAAECGITLEGAIEVDGMDFRRELLVKHNRYTIVPYALFSPEIEDGQLGARRIVNPEFERTLYLLSHRASTQDIEEIEITEIIFEIVQRAIIQGHLRWKSPISE